MFFRRKKDDDIIVDCYTHNEFAYNFAKINYGYHYIPEWWKKTSQFVQPSDTSQYHYSDAKEMTNRNCPGFVQYYKKSIVLPMWCEMLIQITRKGEDNLFHWESSNKCDVQFHPQFQFEKFSRQEGFSLKIMSPWYLKCKENIDFAYSQPVWSQRDLLFNLILLPGILNFKNQMATHLNYFFERGDAPKEVRIQPRTPMLMLHPLSERKVKLRHHYIKKEGDEKSFLQRPISGMLFDDYPNPIPTKKRDKLWKEIDETDGDIYK